MVGETGFEPATPCSQSKCATGLRYSPTQKTCYRTEAQPVAFKIFARVLRHSLGRAALLPDKKICPIQLAGIGQAVVIAAVQMKFNR